MEPHRTFAVHTSCWWMRRRKIEGTGRGKKRRKRCKVMTPERSSIFFGTLAVILVTILVCALVGAAQGLRITSFRMPAYVPITLPGAGAGPGAPRAGAGQSASARHPLELSKPILFDCDYDYRPDEDTRLVVRWFKNKETEPFYQWLPERNISTLADWIQPLVDQSFVSDPIDTFKRYRSLLIRRLSMNLTGLYTCSVSSLGGQDSRVASLVVFQPPETFTFKHRMFPVAAVSPLPARTPAPPPSPLSAPHSTRPPPQPSTASTRKAAFLEGEASQSARAIIHPANNNYTASTTSRPLFTHDGKPVRRNGKRSVVPTDWQLRQRLMGGAGVSIEAQKSQPQLVGKSLESSYQLQVHHFECQASQVTPRPLLLLTVKRGANAIAQYMHEQTRTSWHHYQVNQADYYGTDDPSAEPALPVTLYDITASVTVTLNVSLDSPSSLSAPFKQSGPTSARNSQPMGPPGHQRVQLPPGALVFQFRRGQRMSFECHLEVTGTEFGDKQRININEEEVYRLAELEEHKRLLHQANDTPFRDHMEAEASSGARSTKLGQLLSSCQLIAAAASIASVYLASQSPSACN